MGSTDDIAHHAALDARMVKIARGIRLLNEVSWPASLQEPFLDGWRRGQPQLPKVEYAPQDFSAARRELDAIAGEADEAHPLGRYIAASARNWAIAAELLEALGTPAVTAHSIRLFGRPDEPLPGNGPSTRDAARCCCAPMTCRRCATRWRCGRRSSRCGLRRSQPPVAVRRSGPTTIDCSPSNPGTNQYFCLPQPFDRDGVVIGFSDGVRSKLRTYDMSLWVGWNPRSGFHQGGARPRRRREVQSASLRAMERGRTSSCQPCFLTWCSTATVSSQA